MKKILTNGCSFVAGDEIVWDKYIKENNRTELSWENLNLKDLDILNFFNTYKNSFRKKFNFPAMLANKLNLELVDISEDGSSNDSIAITTILYLLTISKEEYENIHVVIGWTAETRFIKYSKIRKNQFSNITLNTSIHKSQFDLFKENFFYCRAILNFFDEDYFFNYIKNILLLENFLKANKITYTFYRSLGSSLSSINHNNIAHLFKNFNDLDLTISTDTFTDNNSWFKFVSNDKLGFVSESLQDSYLTNESNWISKNNSHPNLYVMDELSTRISNFIRNNTAYK